MNGHLNFIFKHTCSAEKMAKSLRSKSKRKMRAAKRVVNKKKEMLMLNEIVKKAIKNDEEATDPVVIRPLRSADKGISC